MEPSWESVSYLECATESDLLLWRVRIRDNQIIEGWDNWDQLGMLKQIGVYQSPQNELPKSA